VRARSRGNRFARWVVLVGALQLGCYTYLGELRLERATGFELSDTAISDADVAQAVAILGEVAAQFELRVVPYLDPLEVQRRDPWDNVTVAAFYRGRHSYDPNWRPAENIRLNLHVANDRSWLAVQFRDFDRAGLSPFVAEVREALRLRFAVAFPRARLTLRDDRYGPAMPP